MAGELCAHGDVPARMSIRSADSAMKTPPKTIAVGSANRTRSGTRRGNATALHLLGTNHEHLTYHSDEYNTRLAIATLKDHLEKKPDKPLFLGLGFHKPHLHFIAPKRNWVFTIPKTSVWQFRCILRRTAWLWAFTSRWSCASATAFQSPARSRMIWRVRSYCACVSYVDAQIGPMIDALEEGAAPVFVELYDHKKDPNERVNVASQHPELVAQLTARLRMAMK